MLRFITSISDQLLDYIKDDPVRPEIPSDFRVTNNRFIAALVGDSTPESMVCVSLHNFIPSSVEELHNTVMNPTTAVFYTIWSYKPGSGKKLLEETVLKIIEQYPSINTFVTLSPKTEMAKKFHLKNGAVVYRENESTINYKYSPSLVL